MRVFFVSLLLFLLPGLTGAENTFSDSVTTDLDWRSGVIHVTIERPLSAEGNRGPAAISRTQRAIRRQAPETIAEVLTTITFNSLFTVGEYLEENEHRISALAATAEAASPIDAGASPDLQNAHVTFEVDLYRDLASRFITHTEPLPIPSRIDWVAHTDYTGILIYAAESLPLFGTDENAYVRPALFPGLYYRSDREGLLYRIAEAEHIDHTQLGTNGGVGYTDDVRTMGFGGRWSDRIGTRPLRILAIGAFGRNATDIVISEDDARQIMASQHNRSLVQEGRVVIVVHQREL